MYALIIMAVLAVIVVLAIGVELRVNLINRKARQKHDAEHEANLEAWREGQKGQDSRLRGSSYPPNQSRFYAPCDTEGGGYCVAVVLVLCQIIFFIFACMVPHAAQQGDINDVLELSAKYDLDVQRRDELVAEVTSQLIEAYPRLEQDIIAGVGDPEILLSFPQIRSSETFMAAVENIIALNDKVYSTRRSIIANEADILGRSRSVWVIRPPWFPTYEDYYEGENPLNSQSNTTQEG